MKSFAKIILFLSLSALTAAAELEGVPNDENVVSYLRSNNRDLGHKYGYKKKYGGKKKYYKKKYGSKGKKHRELEGDLLDSADELDEENAVADLQNDRNLGGKYKKYKKYGKKKYYKKKYGSKGKKHRELEGDSVDDADELDEENAVVDLQNDRNLGKKYYKKKYGKKKYYKKKYGSKGKKYRELEGDSVDNADELDEENAVVDLQNDRNLGKKYYKKKYYKKKGKKYYKKKGY